MPKNKDITARLRVGNGRATRVGDMFKSTYDQDMDGVVDNAKALDGHDASFFAKTTDLDGKLDTDGDGSSVTATFTAAGSRGNITSGDTLGVIFGKLAKWFNDLKPVAFTGNYSDLTNTPTYDQDMDGVVDNAKALDGHDASFFAKTTDLEAIAQMTAAIEPDDFRRFWKDYFDSQRTGKVYGVKFPNGATAATTGIKLLDNEGLVCEPSDLTTEGQDDYADIPLFKWWHVNYEREEDGTPYPTAVEGSTDYQTTGAVDVGAMQMSFWWKVEEDSEGWSYLYITDMPKEGFEPWWECIKADGTIVPWVIGSAYFSGEASDGKLRSQPGLAPAINQSYNNMHTNYQRKGAGYHGAGSEANLFQIIFILIKYATQNSQSLFRGCTDYSFQYDAATTRTTEDTWFPVPTSNAVVVGSAVSVGYPTAANSKDRGNTDLHTIANMVKVLSVEDADTYKKVYLDCDPFTVEEDSNGHLPCLSSMEWHAGSTDDVIGHHDGAMVLSDSKHPYRIQGREYAIGGYVVGGREVIDRQNNVATLYSRPKGVAWSNTIATVRSTYDAAALLISNDGDTNPDVWVQKIKMDPDTGVWAPIEGPGASSAQHWCDRYYAGGVFTGQREYLQGGSLRTGSGAGFCYLSCGNGLGSADWHSVARD